MKIKAFLLVMITVLLLSACKTDKIDLSPDKTTAPAQTDADGSVISEEPTESASVEWITNEAGETIAPIGGEITTEAEPSETDKNGKPVPPAKKLPLYKKVGYIYRGSVLNNPSNEIFETVRENSHRLLGVDTCYVENVLVQQFADAVDVLVQSGCNVIISADPAFSNACTKAAKEYAAEKKDVEFVNMFSNESAVNMTSFQPLYYQAANVVGLAAAYNSSTNKLGIVADHTMYNHYAVINSFVQGAKFAMGENINVRLNLSLSEDESNTKIAIDDLINSGCDVIFVYQNNNYGIKYCEWRGVKVVAFTNRINDLAPNTYITGMFMNPSGYLNEAVRYMQNDAFAGRTQTGSLGEKYVSITSMNPANDDADAKAAIDKLLLSVSESARGDGIFKGEIKDVNKNIQVKKGEALNAAAVLGMSWYESGIVLVKDFSHAKSDDEIVLGQLTVNS